MLFRYMLWFGICNFSLVYADAAYSFRVNENVVDGSDIGSISDVSCTQYELVGLDACCSISSTGVLSVGFGVSLDREIKDRYDGILRCTIDSFPYLITPDVEVLIGDINDNFPVFNNPAQTLSINEKNSVPAEYTLSGAHDGDTQTYSIVRYVLNEHTDKFSLKTGTWSAGVLPLFLVINTELDYDTVDKMYDLTITAFDSDDNSDTMTLTITVVDINDNKPVFNKSSYSGTVSEGAATQTTVLSLSAVDADSGDNGRITYTLSGDTPFKILDNGKIVVSGNLDREDVSSYTFQVTASDNGDPPQRSTVSVTITLDDINDNKPVINTPTQNQIVEIKENLPEGSLVCPVTVTDADTGLNAEITVRITGSYSDRFLYEHVQGATGRMVTTELLDREDTEQYTLVIVAQDKGDPVRTAEVQFTLRVTDDNDNDPEITNCGDEIVVFENYVGTVLTVAATDRDTGDNAELMYSTAAGAYSVSGEGVLSLNVQYDYESTKSDSVTVTVTDKGGRSTSCTYSVTVSDVNDNAPVIEAVGEVSVSEDADVGTVVFTLTATDVDVIDEDMLRYEMVNPSLGPTAFRVESETGAVVVNDALDRESRDRYNLTFVVYDSGRVHSSTVQVEVVVSDVSDTAPVFVGTPYKVDISDSVLADQVIFSVTAEDPDIDDVTLTYTTDDALFNVAAASGGISLKSPLTLDSPSETHNLVVSVSDSIFTTDTMVAVTVYQDDGVEPVITTFTGYTVSESAPPGSPAGECRGTAHSPLTYTLESVLFTIDSSTGDVVTSGALDYEEYFEYRLVCRVTDVHLRSAQHMLTVKVEGVNEFPPRFEKSFYSFKTDDKVDKDRIVGRVIASDGDRGNDGILQFYLADVVQGWDIDPGTGDVIQKSDVNLGKRSAHGRERRDTQSSFHSVELEVGVRDSASVDFMFDTATVTISVYAYVDTGAGDQLMILIGSAAAGTVFIIVLVVVLVNIVIRRRRSQTGSKSLTYVNPTVLKDSTGRDIVTDGGYHSANTTPGVQLQDLTFQKGIQYSNEDTNGHYMDMTGPYENLGSRDTPIGSRDITLGSRDKPLTYTDKMTSHKMSVSTVLSDIQTAPRVGAMIHGLSYESVHVFGSEGGGEGDAVIDAHSLFKTRVDDDNTSLKQSPFLGEEDSAFSSLGSSSGDIQAAHSEYLHDWKPAFQSVGTVCKGMLGNKQFLYKSNHSNRSAPFGTSTTTASRDSTSPTHDSTPPPPRGTTRDSTPPPRGGSNHSSEHILDNNKTVLPHRTTGPES